jgi:hypothetical protein
MDEIQIAYAAAATLKTLDAFVPEDNRRLCPLDKIHVLEAAILLIRLPKV